MRYDGVNGVVDGLAGNSLLNERDDHMGAELARLASTNQTVVAVIGAAHMRGVRRAFARHTLAAYINAQGRALYEDWKRAKAEELLGLEAEAWAMNELLKDASESDRSASSRFLFTLPTLTIGRAAFAAALLAGGIAIASHSKQPSHLLPLYGTGLVTVAAGVHLGLAVATANWAQFGEFLGKQTSTEKESKDASRVGLV